MACFGSSSLVSIFPLIFFLSWTKLRMPLFLDATSDVLCVLQNGKYHFYATFPISSPATTTGKRGEGTSPSSRLKFKNKHNSSSYRYVRTSLPRFLDNREVLCHNIIGRVVRVSKSRAMCCTHTTLLPVYLKQ